MIKFTKARCFLVNLTRFYTTKPQEPLVFVERENGNNWVNIQIYYNSLFLTKGSNYLTLKLNNKPANTLSLEFINEINANLDKIEQDKTVHGVILTSVR